MHHFFRMQSKRSSPRDLVDFISSQRYSICRYLVQPNSSRTQMKTRMVWEKSAPGQSWAVRLASWSREVTWATMTKVGQQMAMLASEITRMKGFTPVVSTRILRFAIAMMTPSRMAPLISMLPMVPKLSSTVPYTLMMTSRRDTTPKTMARLTFLRKTVWLKKELVSPGWQRLGSSQDCFTECSSSNTAQIMMGQLVQKTLQNSQMKTLKMTTPEKQVKPPKAMVAATWNQFFQKLQLAICAFLRYHSRPQYRVSSFMNLNSPATKSATLAASVPSFPFIPTPTSAAVIMFTSLAPSPTAMVSAGDFSLKMVTIYFLLAGVQRQQMVWSEGSSLGITFSAFSRNTFFSFISFSFFIFSCHPCSSPASYVGMSTSSASLSTNPHERPMFIAVSLLSPVRMKNVIPASLISVMVLMTSSWSSSSMAVAPTNSRFFYIFQQQRLIASSFFCPTIPLASLYYLFHYLKAYSLIFFFPSIKVRSPFILRLSMWVCVTPKSFQLARSSSFTVESAPFVYRMIDLL